jgi:hypothetical protein
MSNGEEEVRERSFEWGINIPWWYCHDLGPNHIYPHWPVLFSDALVESTFAFLKTINISLVRFWLFEGGEGLAFDSNGKIIQVDEVFLTNLRTFTSIAQKHRIRVLYTLLDANSVYRNGDFLTESILCNGGNTLAFCEKVLPTVLEIIKPTAWGVDICNEPEAVIAGPTGNYDSKGYTWSRITGNLSKIIQAVRSLDATLRVTVGSGFQEERNVMAGYYHNDLLGLDFIDYHSHRTDGFVPQAELISARNGNLPVVIGELSACELCPQDCDRQHWMDNQAILSQRLHHLLDEPYLAVFLWRLDPHDQRNSTAFDTLVYNGEASRIFGMLHERESGSLPTAGS